MNKRASIQLSMNFIVVIIISIVIFGFGIRFVYNIFSSSEALKEMTLEQIDRQISDLMCSSNEMVCLEKDTMQVRPGKVVIIGVKITNVPDQNAQNNEEFTIRISNGPYIDNDNQQSDLHPSDIAVKPETRPVKIKPNDAARFGSAFEVPKDISRKGTYIFNLEVFRGPVNPINKYDKTHKIYIKVI